MRNFEVRFYLKGILFDGVYRIQAMDMQNARNMVDMEIWNRDDDWFEWYDERTRTSPCFRKKAVSAYVIAEI